ncbi:Alpha-2-macroglobulin MG1 domain protein [Planctomycetes bacterium Pla163]|uniref:Alpha-2-macroglobulin MG1 domain protein n=1 Tax=Rohdeia mirabilis TaxID=2528008 RepID=A0A518D2V5_9BACT|nr:Alpha-2-macroglobulin MG1 domain protein [Planctomycetes bacterium Pla163]
MKARTLVMLSAIALIAVALFWLLRSGGSDDLAALESSGTAAAVERDAERVDDLADSSIPGARAALEAEPQSAAVAETSPQPDPFAATDTSAVFEVAVTHAETGEPVAGLRVDLYGAADDDPRGTTGDDGVVRFEVDARDAIEAVRIHSGATTVELYESKLPNVLPGEVVRFDAVVGAGWSIAGRCVDESGRPVAGATVRGWCRGRNYGACDREVVADGDGRWQLDHLGPTVWVQAHHPELGLVSAIGLSQYERPSKMVEHSLLLVPGIDLDLRVVDSTGRGIEGVRVMSGGNAASQTLLADGVTRSISAGRIDSRTDANGDIRVEGLPPRTYEFRFTHEPYAPFIEFVKLDGSKVVLELDSGLGVGGVVLDAAGEPAVGATVRIGPNSHGDTSREGVTTDENGRFVVGGLLDPKTLRHAPWIVVHHEGHAVEVVQPVVVAPNAAAPAVDVRLSRGDSITGRVLLDGRPVEGAQVWVVSDREMDANFFERPNTWEIAGGGGEARTTPDGRFELTHLHLGDVTVRVQPLFERDRAMDFTVPAGARDVDLEITSERMRGIVVLGTVTDFRSGAPIPKFKMRPTNSSSIEGVDGEYEYESFPSGKRGIDFEAPGYMLKSLGYVEYPEGENRVDVQLVPSASLSVKVVGADGQPVGLGCQVELHVSPGFEALKAQLDEYWGAQRTLESGVARFDDLPAHPLTVHAFVPGDTVETTVDLSSGGEHELEIVTSGTAHHDHRIRFLVMSAELDATEVVRRLRSGATDDVQWVEAQEGLGLLREPDFLIGVTFHLPEPDDVGFVSMCTLHPLGEMYRLQVSGVPNVEVSGAEIALRLADGDWEVSASAQNDQTRQQLSFDVHSDLSNDGSELGVVLFVESAQ